MSSWLSSLFGGTPQPDVKIQDQVIDEAHIVKDFYDRMITTCLHKCNASSHDAEDEIVKYNCMDRCLQKFTETKQVIEEHIENKTNQK